MRWRISFKASLGGKFLLSYLLIVLVGVATLLVVTFALAPTLFQAQLMPILQTHPNSLTTSEASQRILGDFLGTLLVALAVAAIAVTRELRLNPEKVNVNGGAVAIGHPIGASGARILVTLLYELQRRNLKRGIATLCLGGGNAVALAVERY